MQVVAVGETQQVVQAVMVVEEMVVNPVLLAQLIQAAAVEEVMVIDMAEQAALAS
jgi:hypothetical protein